MIIVAKSVYTYTILVKTNTERVHIKVFSVELLDYIWERVVSIRLGEGFYTAKCQWWSIDSSICLLQSIITRLFICNAEMINCRPCHDQMQNVH